MEETDLISKLPESIIHHILSYLNSPKDLVRMSILSYYWFGFTASFPIFNFNYVEFMQVLKSSGTPFDTEEHQMDLFFLKYVQYTISRFCEQNVSVHTFNIMTSFRDLTDVAIIDKCLGLILENGVKVLVIDMHNWTYRLQHPQMYHVPNIFLSAPSLASLKLCYCEIPSSFMVDVVKFKSLKLLHIECVRLNEEVITSFTTSCPLLEEFIVIYCYGLKRFCVYEHLNLRQVKIRFIPEFDRIDIDAPNLCFLCLHCKYDERGVSPSMNLASCKKLTKVCYHGERLVDLSHNFPFLEDLFLDLPKKCKRLTLSSHSLRTFMLNSECDLGNIDLNAPNLLLFGFTDNLHFHSPMGSFSIPSKPCMEWDHNTLVEDNWFKKLRQFLDKKLRFKELKLHINVVLYRPKLN
ncbi:F-box domain, Leucine-rich repeat domain, L domain-like protein [Artemisia annua]|uniref:F-box domain, Leucine-rich repeat domain, L domain-like protein n=1 Tax=Artemisia annua TaxID=35608 RepID=A0A2U1KRS5_ARTAN|nr:F-box domain, Leucine-rich repeat domain, L domain-like protein [Artemisia annua]